MYLWTSGGSDGKESTCNAGDQGLIPGSGRSPGEGNGNSLQSSCLENPMDRGAWRATEGCKELDMTERLSKHTRLIHFAVLLKLRHHGWVSYTPIKIFKMEDFLGGPVVKTLLSSARGAGLIPGRWSKIPQALRPANQNIKQTGYCNKYNKNFKNDPCFLMLKFF